MDDKRKHSHRLSSSKEKFSSDFNVSFFCQLVDRIAKSQPDAQARFYLFYRDWVFWSASSQSRVAQLKNASRDTLIGVLVDSGRNHTNSRECEILVWFWQYGQSIYRLSSLIQLIRKTYLH